jgi:hypothetical protein
MLNNTLALKVSVLDIEELQVNDGGEQTDVDDTERDKHVGSCEGKRRALLAPTIYPEWVGLSDIF